MRKLYYVILTYFLKEAIKKIYISEKVRTNAKIVWGDICRFWHLLSNGEISKIVFRDLDLHYKVKNLKLVDFDICRRMVSLRKIVLRNLDLLSERSKFKFLLSLKR